MVLPFTNACYLEWRRLLMAHAITGAVVFTDLWLFDAKELRIVQRTVLHSFPPYLPTDCALMTTVLFLRAFVLHWAVAFIFAPLQYLQAQDEDVESGVEYFERHVRPLLAEKCFACHGRGQRKGSLSLNHRDSLIVGGESGVVVVTEKPEESLLVEAIEYSGSVQMPPDGKLGNREIQVLKKWIALGLPWPDEPPSNSSMRNPVHIHDLHATILHLMGIDHERLRYRYSGRDFRLTDVHGRVVHDILA